MRPGFVRGQTRPSRRLARSMAQLTISFILNWTRARAYDLPELLLQAAEGGEEFLPMTPLSFGYYQPLKRKDTAAFIAAWRDEREPGMLFWRAERGYSWTVSNLRPVDRAECGSIEVRVPARRPWLPAIGDAHWWVVLAQQIGAFLAIVQVTGEDDDNAKVRYDVDVGGLWQGLPPWPVVAAWLGPVPSAELSAGFHLDAVAGGGGGLAAGEGFERLRTGASIHPSLNDLYFPTSYTYRDAGADRVPATISLSTTSFPGDQKS